MKFNWERLNVKLARHAMLHLEDARGVRVVCHGGGLWITEERDLRDIELAAGEGFLIDRDGLTLVWAVKPATVELIEPARAAGIDRAPAWLRPLLRELRGFWLDWLRLRPHGETLTWMHMAQQMPPR